MLGTFSFEPYFKSYRWFTVGSLKFLEIAFGSLFPFLQLACLLLLPPPLCSAAARRGGPARPPPASRWHPRVAPNLLHRPLPRAGALSTLPRAPAEPSSRHLAVAVASLLQSPPLSPRVRTSITSTPSFHSACSFTCSPLRRPRTPPPLRRTPVSPGPPSTRLTAAPPPALTP
jgi:hypothetical protein